jgi:hypothetical protein
MTTLINHLFYFTLIIALLYWVTKSVIQQLYYVLKRLLKKDSVVFTVLAIIFLPGTVLHEYAHYLTAALLGLEVRGFSIIPSWKDRSLRLGHVIYVRKDRIRGTLVGTAPLFVGLLVLYGIFYVNFLSYNSIFIKSVTIYLIVIVCSTMYSSKQDLKDLAGIVPVLIVICIIYFLLVLYFHISLPLDKLNLPVKILQPINRYLLLSLGINATLYIMLLILNHYYNDH